MVVYDESNALKVNEEHCSEFSQVVPAKIVSDSEATKDNVIKRVTSGSASLVHFLVHGTSGGRPGRRWYQGMDKEERETCITCSSFKSISGMSLYRLLGKSIEPLQA